MGEELLLIAVWYGEIWQRNDDININLAFACVFFYVKEFLNSPF